jgi:hypothetical protein
MLMTFKNCSQDLCSTCNSLFLFLTLFLKLNSHIFSVLPVCSEWLHNIEEEKKRRIGNGGNDFFARPINHDEDNDHPRFPPMLGGMINRGQLRANKPGDGHICVYSRSNANYACKLCFKPHENCCLIGDNHCCNVCYRPGENCPPSETKPHYVISRLLKLYTEQQEAKKSSIEFDVPVEFRADQKRPLKVIVFSQFRKILNLTGDRLLRQFGNGCVAEYWGMYRKKELERFCNDEKVFCMLLGKDGSEGLDLSFVTHIIFLEQVWDKSLQSQAVARAWRMGARGPVEVETLIAENSIEETMAELEKGLEQDGEVDSGDAEDVRSIADGSKASEYQKAKVNHLLKHLRLISNSTTLGFAAGEKRKAPESLKIVEMTESLAPRKKKRSEELNVRFHEQVLTFEFDVN